MKKFANKRVRIYTYGDVSTGLLEVQNAVNKELNIIRNETIIEIFDKLVNDSPYGDPTLWKSKPPKDYHPGHFKSNWQISRRNPATSIINSVSLTPTADHIRNATSGETLYIANNVPYALRLEEGWSTQRPAGWVRKTMAMAESIIEKLAKEGG